MRVMKVIKMKLMLLTLISLFTCYNGNESIAFPTSERKNETTTEEFVNDARFGKGGGGSGTSTWAFSSNAARSRIVETKYGRVQGLSITLFPNLHNSGSGNKNFMLKNKIVEIFLGIPYAAPPVKSRRFSPTQTPIPWQDVKATIQPSAVCPQIFPDIRNDSIKEMPKGYLEYLRNIQPYLRNQSEDCLYLNVFSPIGPDAKLKPVVVWIHGGMFAWGSGNLVDGTVMGAYAHVIFVTLNYRLNILGFLNLNDSPNSKPRVSNYGLMDIIAALHWIKENIVKFNGNPDSITLIGYEAGAACINFLMSSPTVNAGLFHRGFLIAGSASAPWALISEPSIVGMNLAEALNCSGNNSSGNEHQGTTQSPLDPVMDCLRTKPHFSDFTKFSLPKFSVDFAPSVDGIVIKPSFRSNQGKREAVSKKYDLLAGLSSLERLIEFNEMDLEIGFEAPRRDAILRTLVRNSYRFHRNEILATITNEYIDWERTAQHPITTREMTVHAVTDCLSLSSVVAALSDTSSLKKSFFYVFEHSTKDGLYNYHRAGGGEELSYMFGYPLVESATGHLLPFIPSPLPSNYSKGEVAVSELWMTFISNFAHSGNPNGPIKVDSISSWTVSKERNRFKSVVWEPYDPLHQKYLEIGGTKTRSKSHYRAHQMAIWLRLVPELVRSGAQMANSFHNRMRGGNDPLLYSGRLKQIEEEEENPLAENNNSGMNSGLLYDLLLGYGIGGGGTGVVGGDTENQNMDVSESKGGDSSLTMTTCYSPVSSSVRGTTHADNDTDNVITLSSTFPTHSMILAITIAVGCSILVLNIAVFGLIYFQRGRRKRAKRARERAAGDQMSGDVEHHNCDGSASPAQELLKSNRTTTSSFVGNSQGNLKEEMESLEVLELRVKQHQQELLGEKALLFHNSTLPRHSSDQIVATYSMSTVPRSWNGSVKTGSNSSKPI